MFLTLSPFPLHPHLGLVSVILRSTAVYDFGSILVLENVALADYPELGEKIFHLRPACTELCQGPRAVKAFKLNPLYGNLEGGKR